jgi:putative transposase
MAEREDMPELKALSEARAADCSPDSKKAKKQAKKERSAATAKAEINLREAVNGERINEGEYRKELNRLKKEKYPWMYEAAKCAVQLAIKNDFANAMKHFRGKEKFGFPRFKKRGEMTASAWIIRL